MLRLMHRIFFSLNLAFAVALAVALFSLRWTAGVFVHGNAVSPDFFQNLSISVNLAFNRVPWAAFGTIVAVIGLTLTLTGILLLFLTLLGRTEMLTLTYVAGTAATLAVPLSWSLLALKAWPAFILEFALVGGALYLTRKRPNPFLFMALTFHYSVWAWFVWAVVHDGYALLLDWPWPMLLSVVAPCSGFLWALYTMHTRGMNPKYASSAQ